MTQIEKFAYCSYWRRWSRLLSENHPRGPFVEVNLTPIANCYDSTWENDVAPVRIRAHFTARDYQDRLVSKLPPEVKNLMASHLGEELTERLLTEDFLPQIDWNLYQKKCNGGANLEDIRLR